MLNPNDLFKQAFQLYQAGRLNEAEFAFQKVIKISPSHIGAKTMLGSIYVQTDRIFDGIKLLENSLKKDPRQFWALNTLAVGFINQNQYQKAFLALNKAIDLKPDYIDAFFNLGKVNRALGRFGDAISNYSKCISFNSNYADAFSNRGNIYLEDLNQPEKALSDFQAFIALTPNSWHGSFNLGNALRKLQRFDQSILSYERAIQLNPEYSDIHFNCGLSFYDLKHYGEAISSYERAIQLNPKYAEVYFSRGAAHSNMRNYRDALQDYDRAFKLNPEIDFLLGSFIYTKAQLCDWDDYKELVIQLQRRIESHKKTSSPLAVQALVDSPHIQRQCAEVFIRKEFPLKADFNRQSKNSMHPKIRLAYFSADFREHPVSYLTAELFELHNRDRFELIAFSFGADTQDSLRKRLELAFDRFVDVKDKTDQEIVALVKEMEIDIAVDLTGFTEGCRTNIFAMRAAPIQVNYLGYPGTMAAEYMDYIIADPTLIPDEQQCHYSEKVAYLPATYMVNDSALKPSEKVFSRSDFNLPEEAFIFACFNAPHKITPAIFSGWMRILKAVDQSVLWLSHMNEIAINNLKNAAQECGIDSHRIIFASRIPSVNDHLNRIKLADLFLDTFPYNAHTTCNDALRVGLPVLTLMGASFASRVAASLLNAVNMPEFIVNTQEAYEAFAIELATNPEMLKKLRSRLLSNLPTSDLLNTKRFTKHLESVYQAMYQRYQDDFLPDHIYVRNDE